MITYQHSTAGVDGSEFSQLETFGAATQKSAQKKDPESSAFFRGYAVSSLRTMENRSWRSQKTPRRHRPYETHKIREVY